MAPSPVSFPRLLILDDDLLTREVLSLMATDAGYRVQAFDSGDAALASLAATASLVASDAFTATHEPPHAVLVDMQMPGTSGDALAQRLRSACGPATTLVAMSATVRADSPTRAFDAFLLKPFKMEELKAVLGGKNSQQKATPPPVAALSDATYQSLAQSMPADQLLALYMMCLDDADRRIDTMRVASASGDLDTFRRAAHSIKGGCGMVGALECAALAAKMEDHPMPDVGDVSSFEGFLEASARVRRILIAQENKQSPDRPSD